MIHLEPGTLPSVSYLSIAARITASEAREVIEAMRRAQSRGQTELLAQMLAAYGFAWLAPTPRSSTATRRSDHMGIDAVMYAEVPAALLSREQLDDHARTVAAAKARSALVNAADDMVSALAVAVHFIEDDTCRHDSEKAGVLAELRAVLMKAGVR